MSGPYCWVYKPAADFFPGPDTRELKTGQWYEEWVPNDHAFIRGPDDHWHIFGITHPKTGLSRVHEGEFLSLHAKSPETGIRKSLVEHSWKDLPKVLSPLERENEPLANHAPFVVRKGGLYHMIYGPSPIRLAVSEDLMNWETRGALFEDADGARDPNLLYHDGDWYLIYCSKQEIKMRRSKDLINWSDSSSTILYMKQGIDPESPSLIRYNDTFYLFVCGWNGVWDRSSLSGAYQHKTCVFNSDDPWKFDTIYQVAVLDAHAPEVFRGDDDEWYISSVEWPNRGINIAPLIWD